MEVLNRVCLFFFSRFTVTFLVFCFGVFIIVLAFGIFRLVVPQTTLFSLFSPTLDEFVHHADLKDTFRCICSNPEITFRDFASPLAVRHDLCERSQIRSDICSSQAPCRHGVAGNYF
eukprot:GABV01009886.1.p1 GENE.GABV01009886.1~~GABV01009886.1.p1  ORF type:complete len:117 (+),score=26.56 GABV01009886.1:100-450(+)